MRFNTVLRVICHLSLLSVVLGGCHHVSLTPETNAPAEQLVAQAVIKMHDGDTHVFMPVTIHGHAATVVLDLGADQNLLDRDQLTHFGIDTVDADGRLVVDSLTIGAVAERQIKVNGNAFVIAAPLRAPVAALKMPPFLGILGTPVLAHYDLAINGPTGEVRLYRPVSLRRTSETLHHIAAWFPSGITSGDCVPIQDESDDSHFVLFLLSVNGHAVLGDFDSGAAFDAMNMKAAQALGLTQHTPGVRPVDASQNVSFPGAGVASTIQYDLVGSDVAIGTRHLAPQTIRIVQHYPIRTVPLVALGLDAFRDRVIFISYSTRQVCLGAPRSVRP